MCLQSCEQAAGRRHGWDPGPDQKGSPRFGGFSQTPTSQVGEFILISTWGFQGFFLVVFDAILEGHRAITAVFVPASLMMAVGEHLSVCFFVPE